MKNEIIIFEKENIKLKVNLNDETVWLTQEQMAELFGKNKSTINEHISNVFKEKELQKTEVMRKFGISEFSTKPTNFYNLYVIISVDYRVGFEAFKLQYGYNRFVMSPTKWIENTNAIGFITKDGKSLKKGINYIFNFEFFK